MNADLDYTHRMNWLHRPSSQHLRYAVDTFFVYPTVYVHPDKSGHHLMPIDNPAYRAAARLATHQKNRYLAPYTNMFAPMYRQVGMETLYARRSAFNKLSKTPYRDIRNAFYYYLEHLNNGRPFILAGHSQGSEMILKLLAHDVPSEARNRHIATFAIGYSVTKQQLAQFPHMKLAQSGDDLDCIISYNTSAVGLHPLPVVLPGAVAVNPLNWLQTDEYAPKELNTASVFFQAGRAKLMRSHFTGAQLDEAHGTLMIDQDALETLRHMGYGHLIDSESLHHFDISLFSGNLETSVRERIRAYWAREHAQES